MVLDYKSNCYTAINLNRDYHNTTTMISDAYVSMPSLHAATHETPRITHVKYFDRHAYYNYASTGLVSSEGHDGRDAIAVACLLPYA